MPSRSLEDMTNHIICHTGLNQSPIKSRIFSSAVVKTLLLQKVQKLPSVQCCQRQLEAREIS